MSKATKTLRAIHEANVEGMKTIWACDRELDQVLFKGTFIVVFPKNADDAIERDYSKYLKTKVTNPTGWALWKAVEKLFSQSEDHHKYIEDFKVIDGNIITIITGS